MLGIKTQPGVLAPKPAKNPPDPTQPNNPTWAGWRPPLGYPTRPDGDSNYKYIFRK